MLLEALFPWVLASLALLPATLLPPDWQWTSFPTMGALLAFGYWLVWPRMP